MAEELYEEYAGLLDQQVDLAEKAVVGVVRAALADFTSDFKRHLRSLVPPGRPPATSGAQASSQQMTRAEEEIEAACDSAQRQIATALANGFGALGFSANKPSVLIISEPPTQATVGANATNNDDNSDEDSMSIKSEDTSECESDCDSHSDDETEIKEEEAMEEDTSEMAATAGTSNVNPNNNETEIQSTDNPNPNDSNFETVPSQLVNLTETNREQESAGMLVDDAEASHEEGDDVPTIIVVDYGKFETVNEQLSEGMIEASSEQDQTGPSTVADTAPTMTRRSARASAAKKVNYSGARDNSVTEQKDTLAGTRKRKRPIGRSGESNTPKRIRVVPGPTVAAEFEHQVNDEIEEEEDPEPEALSFHVIVRRLKCHLPGCKEAFPCKVQLDGHLLAKHGIEKYACKVKDCTESYATWGQLSAHRSSAHGDLDNDWPCGQCEVTCLNYQNLCTHTYFYHEYGLFACPAYRCNHTEETRAKVRIHEQTHRASSFKQKSHLTSHLRTRTKENPFICSQCTKTFSSKGSLTAHELIHSGLKPYSCTWPHCDFSANQKSHVITHVRTVHFHLPKSKTEQAKQGIIDDRDARLFLKKTTTTGN